MSDKKINVGIGVKGTDEVKARLKEIEKGTNLLGGAALTTTKSVKAMFLAFISNPITALIAGVTALFAAFKKGSTEAAEAEVSINDLSASMQNAGVWSEEAMNGAIGYASSLQEQTKFSDDAILSAQALLVSYTKLTGVKLNDLTLATADIASKLKMDIPEAARLVGKAFSSDVNPFARMGITINGASGSAERLQSILKAVSGFAGGSATSQMNTFSGSLTRAKNMFGELFEAIGGGVNLAFKPLVDGLSTLFSNLATLIKKFNTAIQLLFVDLKTALKITFEGIKEIISAPFKISTYTDILSTLINGITSVFIKLGGAIKAGLKLSFEEAKKLAKSALTELTDNQTSFKDDVKAIVEQGEKEKQEIIAKSNGKIVNLNADLLANLDNEEKISDKDKEEARKKRVDKYIDEQKAITLENTRGREKRAEDEIEETERILQNTELTEEERRKIILQKDEQKNKLILQNQENLEKGLALIRQSFDDLQIIATATKSKELYEIGKAGAIATATVDAYVAFNKSLSTLPFPFSLIGAGAALTTGLATVAKISSQSVPFAQGGQYETRGAQYSTNSGGQQVVTGEAGKEMVTVEPIGKSSINGNNQPLQVSIKLDGKTIAKQLYPYIQAVNRRII